MPPNTLIDAARTGCRSVAVKSLALCTRSGQSVRGKDPETGVAGCRILCRSDAFECLESAGADRFGERVIVLVVLVCVAFGEVGDRLVELVFVAEVGGERDRVA